MKYQFWHPTFPATCPSFLLHFPMILQQLVPPEQFSCSTVLQFARSWYFSTFSFSFSPILSASTAISIILHFLSCLFTTTMSSLLASMTWSHRVFTSHNSLTSLFSLTLSGPCSYHLSFFSRWHFSHNFQWTAFITLSYLCLYSLWASFLRSQTIWLTLSPFSQQFSLHNKVPLFCQYGILHS